jgi:hypothetical protein
MLVVGATATVSGLQFVYPDLLEALRRDPGAIRGGELWRLVTALFVQPNGIGQCLANGFLILAIMPAAEKLYGRNILTVYFASGIMGQIVNYFWDSGSGGSSTAIFGIIVGALVAFVLPLAGMAFRSGETDTFAVPKDLHRGPVLRENFIQADFIGFQSFWAPCFRHEDTARGVSHTVSQSACLYMVQSRGMDPDSRPSPATQHIQAEVEKTSVEKRGPAVLVFALKNPEELGIGVDPCQT